jgi:hypothetical protein
MSTNDFLREQAARSQQAQTRQRRENRSHRRSLYVIVGLASIVALVIAAPSLVSQSAIGRSLVISTIGQYGLHAEVESMRIGWTTPLRIAGLRMHGDAGSIVAVDQLDVELTATDLLRSNYYNLGQVTVSGVEIECQVRDQRCSLETDLAVLLEPSDEPSNLLATIKVQDLTAAITDTADNATWRVTQSSAEVDWTIDRIQASIVGVLTEPSGSGGSMQGSAEYLLTALAADDPQQQLQIGLTETNPWRVDLQSESLPLSIVTLLRRRFPETAGSIPNRIHGDATGAIVLVGAADGSIEGTVKQLNIRNFTAAEQGSRAWSNRLATLHGHLSLIGDRVIGRQMTATTDFAAAELNGSFSRSFSLVGANDNPLRWLEAIDGTAKVEADLAAVAQALPGLLPLRDEAELLSGRVVAQVDTAIDGPRRRSKLSVNSDVIRARSGGQSVMIDPVEFVATVSSDGGPLKADQFQWKSAFGSAIGQGDLRSGKADVEIDFGRLTTMLRPIMHISESTLAGSIRGRIDWNAADNNVWRLSGQGDATNLLVSMPHGRTLRRPSMQAKVEAIGRWGSDSLAELTRAEISLATTGLNLHAELVDPVRQPSSSVPLPIQVVGSGRVDTCFEIFGPWLPANMHDAAGTFQATARADVTTTSARLTTATIDLVDAKIASADRYFSQPNLKVNFDGAYQWPANKGLARSMTIAGDAVSVAAQGVVSEAETDLRIKWRAKLERIQGSVRPRLASESTAPFRQVGFRSDNRAAAIEIGSDQWLLMGDCEGSIDLQTRADMLHIETHLSGTELAVVQPRAASSQFQSVGPMPSRPSPQISTRSSRSDVPPGSQIVWAEPNFKLDGSLIYNQQSGQITTRELQIASDWFATTLSGAMVWNDDFDNVRLQGPAKLRVDQVADRLSQLTGVAIVAEGVHSTPLDIQLRRGNDGNLALAVSANLGWERSAVGGMTIGRASVPVVLSETSVAIAPVSIPIGEDPQAMGKVKLAGQVHYRPGPLWLRLDRGSGAESIRLTTEMTDKWLKYLAPLAADTAQIDGTLGVQFDEALIVIDQPEQSRVVGRLNVGGVEMTSGPMADQIFFGINQLRMLSRAGSSSATDPAVARTLITMPPQTVDFFVDRGYVQHNRMFFNIDRAEVITSGRVGMNGQLEIFAQIPLDERWLGSDLKGMANQPITLPINGTLSRPSLDSSGVRRVMAELGTQAVQQSAENYLQKQLGKGIDRLFGR